VIGFIITSEKINQTFRMITAIFSLLSKVLQILVFEVKCKGLYIFFTLKDTSKEEFCSWKPTNIFFQFYSLSFILQKEIEGDLKHQKCQTNTSVAVPGSRTYKNYSDEILQQAIDEVRQKKLTYILNMVYPLLL